MGRAPGRTPGEPGSKGASQGQAGPAGHGRPELHHRLHQRRHGRGRGHHRRRAGRGARAGHVQGGHDRRGEVPGPPWRRAADPRRRTRRSRSLADVAWTLPGGAPWEVPDDVRPEARRREVAGALDARPAEPAARGRAKRWRSCRQSGDGALLDRRRPTGPQGHRRLRLDDPCRASAPAVGGLRRHTPGWKVVAVDAAGHARDHAGGEGGGRHQVRDPDPRQGRAGLRAGGRRRRPAGGGRRRARHRQRRDPRRGAETPRSPSARWRSATCTNPGRRSRW